MNTKKIILIVMAMTALGQGAVALCIPSLPAIAHSLTTTSKLTKDLISLFFLGFGVSQLIYGPLSDRFGRKIILCIGIIIFIIGAILSAFCQTILLLLSTRLIQGLGAGALMVCSRSMLRDTHEGSEFTRATAFLSMAFAIGYGSFPLIGSYIQQLFNWQYTFIFLALSGLALLISIIFFLPETIQEKQNTETLWHYLKNILKKYAFIMQNIHFLAYLIGGAFAYSIVISYSILTPFLIQNQLHFSPKSYGWLTIVIAICYYFGAYINKCFVKMIGAQNFIKIGLMIILLSGFAMLISTYIMPLSIWLIMVPLAFATIGQTFIYSNCIAGALHDFPNMTGSAAALFSSLQLLCATGISTVLSVIHIHNQGSIGLILLVLGGLALLTLSPIMTKKPKTLTA